MPRHWLAARAPRAPRSLLALLTAAAFVNSIPNGFVWLDHWQVEAGGLIVRSWADVVSAVQSPLGAMPGWEGSAPYARPCVVLLLSLVHAVAGARPAAYHLTLVAIHVANVLLVYGVLIHLRIARPVAFLTAAVFGVHPLQTAAVAWISGVADPLFAFGVLAALRLQLAASARPRWPAAARIGAVITFTLALGAKETAAVFPLLLLVTYLIFAEARLPSPKEAPADRARAILRSVAPFCVPLIGAAVYRLYVLDAAAFGAPAGAILQAVRLRTVPRLLLSYFTLPLRIGALTVCDDYILSTSWDMRTLLAAVTLGAGCALFARYWDRCPRVTFGASWMVLGLLPVLNIVPILHYRADRFFYFPMIGWSLSCVGLFHAAMNKLPPAAGVPALARRWGPTTVAVASLLLLMGLTIRRNAAFADDETLFGATLQVSPFCPEARTALGDTRLRAGRYAEAVAEYEQARTIQPGRASYVVMPKVLINLGMAHLGRNDYAEAAAAFGEAHRLQPHLLHPLFGLGIANLGLGQVADAATWLEQAHQIAPDDPDVVLNLALSYDRLDRPADALRLYRQYLAHAPRGRARAVAAARAHALDPTQP